MQTPSMRVICAPHLEKSTFSRDIQTTSPLGYFWTGETIHLENVVFFDTKTCIFNIFGGFTKDFP